MRALDYALRLCFFATVPFLATLVSALFPMTGVLVNIALTLAVFALAESVRERAGRSPLLARVMRRRLAFDDHYRAHPPRPFLYYVFYPLLFPYWLFHPEARRELLLYRGLTGGGMAVLVVLAIADYFVYWSPELGVKPFFVIWALLLVVQTLSMFVFLLPVATTVVKLHSERRLPALYLLFGVAAISVSAAIVRLAQRHRHVVSWVTMQRAHLRTVTAPARAEAAQRDALRSVWSNAKELALSTDAEGWIEGDSLERAELVLERFYKDDEAYAFSLHAIPPAAPEIVLLQCRIGGRRPPIWRAMRKSGQEVTRLEDLPSGVLGLERRNRARAPSGRGTARPQPSASAPRGGARVK